MGARNLTQLEIPCLHRAFNLTDGHVHRRWFPKELEILRCSGELFTSTRREDQEKLETSFISNFYRLARQSGQDEAVRKVICTSASMSIEIIANCLRRAGGRVALIEPCFDNIADIFRRHDIFLQVTPEAFLTEPETISDANFENLTALFLVSPNNPTGRSYTRSSLQRIIELCKRRRLLLILDTSFRFYRQDDFVFDEYELLLESGIDFLVIEDTGKTWPTQELKLSILAGRYAGWDQLYDIYTDFILHVSPFALRLLSEFLRVSLRGQMTIIRDIVRRNRDMLAAALANSPLQIVNEELSSVAWIHSPHSNTQIVEAFGRHEVDVLPGNQFFWSDNSLGENYVRVSLSRDPEVFAEAAARIQLACMGL